MKTGEKTVFMILKNDGKRHTKDDMFTILENNDVLKRETRKVRCVKK